MSIVCIYILSSITSRLAFPPSDDAIRDYLKQEAPTSHFLDDPVSGFEWVCAHLRAFLASLLHHSGVDAGCFSPDMAQKWHKKLSGSFRSQFFEKVKKDAELKVGIS